MPLTLELGGKSPVILSETADIVQSAQRIMATKTLNAGQVCLAPDYLFVPAGKENACQGGDRGRDDDVPDA